MPKPVAELKSKWAIHVRAWMQANPGVSYREALTLAKPSYQTKTKPVSKPAKLVKAKAEPKPKPAPKVKAESKSKSTAHLAPWQEHIAKFRKQNPELVQKSVARGEGYIPCSRGVERT